MIIHVFYLVKETANCSVFKKISVKYCAVFVGPCHHGIAPPQGADGGTASDMEGSCE